MTTETTLEIWVIYDHPYDFPDHFVARKFENMTPTLHYITADSVDEIRDALEHRGLACIPRAPSDDPVIMESWL